MRNVEHFLAAVGFLVCVVLLGRMMLSASLRGRLDASAQRTWQRCRQTVVRLWQGATQWRRGRTAQVSAAEVAEEAIRRAKGEVTREGNVYKPKSFKGPRKPH